MSSKAKLSVEVAFESGEAAVRAWAGQFGPVVQYLPPHFTAFYDGRPFAPDWEEFLRPYCHPHHLLWTQRPEPLGFKVFTNAAKGYHALVVEYGWPALRALNTALAGDNRLNTPRSSLAAGFNGPRFAAHVTLAYVSSAAALDVAAVEAAAPPLAFFAVRPTGLSLAFDLKPA